MAGIGRLQEHLPALRTSAGVAAILATFFGLLGLMTGFFILVDRFLFEWLPDGEIVVLALGFLLLSRFFSQKDRYVARFGDSAYARAFMSFGVPGLAIIYASIAHLAYMPGPMIPEVSWKPVLVGVGWLSLIFGAIHWWRAVNALGFDYLMMLHVYHPQDRHIVDSGIHGVIRHPFYAGAVHISTGLACVHAGWYSLLVALVVPIFFLGWIVLVEEKELLNNVAGYADYRRSVPGLVPRFRDVGKYWRALLVGD